MKHRNLSFRLAALCAFVLTLLQCANEPNSSATGTTELVPTVLWKAGGVAVVPDAVDSVRIQVTYGTVTDSRTFPFSASHAVFPSLPTGATVDILFEGLDRAGVVIYRGTVPDVVLSGTTKEVTITAELLTPRSPANLQATAVSPTAIRLTWTDSSSSEFGFIISRGRAVLDTVLANRTTYNDTGLTAATAYSYTVKAYNAAGISLAATNQANASTLTAGANSAPQFAATTREALVKDTLLYRNVRYARKLIASDPDTVDRPTVTASGQFAGLPDSITWTPTAAGSLDAWVKITDGKLSDSIGWRVRVVDTATVKRGLDSGLVAWYPFDGDAKDKSGNGITGTVLGAATSSDRFGLASKSLSFDGVDNYVNLGSSTILDIFGTRQTMSFSCFVKFGRLDTDMSICTKGFHAVADNLGNRYMSFEYIASNGDSALTSFLYNQQYQQHRAKSVKNIFVQDNWHHLVMVRDSAMKIYIDGLDRTVLSVNDGWKVNYNPIFTGTDFIIGMRHMADKANECFFKGSIDDIRIYNRALSAAEISELFHQGGWNGYPVIDTQPKPATKQVGQTAQFSLHATGTSLTYQWYMNGTAIPSATAASYTTPPLVIGDNNAWFKCAVSSGPAVTRSDSVKVTVTGATSSRLDSGLVAYYPFNGNATDASGNGHNGTVHGATLSTDRFGNTNKAYILSAVNDFIDVPTTSGDFNSQIYSISFWILNADSTVNVNLTNPEKAFISRTNTSGNLYGNFVIFEGGGKAALNYMSTNSTMLGSGDDVYCPDIKGNVWKHIVYSVTSDSIRSYLGGQLIHSEPFVAGINFNNAFPIRFGKASNPYWGDFNGALDDIRFYSRALSASEIDSLYREGGLGWQTTLVPPVPSGTWAITGGGISNVAKVSTNPFNLCNILPAGPFTIEMWVYPESTFYRAHFDCNQSLAEARGLFVIKDNNSSGWQRRTSMQGYPAFHSSLNPVFVADDDTLPRGQWSHIAAVSTGTAATIYINGTAKRTVTDSRSTSCGTAAGILLSVAGCKLDNIRVSKIARYQASFDTDTCTDFSTDANTSMLFTMDARNHGDTLFDEANGVTFPFTKLPTDPLPQWTAK